MRPLFFTLTETLVWSRKNRWMNGSISELELKMEYSLAVMVVLVSDLCPSHLAPSPGFLQRFIHNLSIYRGVLPITNASLVSSPGGVARKMTAEEHGRI